MVTREETLKEISKLKKLRILYMIVLILMFCVGVALLIVFISRGGIPDILLSIVAWIWCAILIYQLVRTRELVALMNANLERPAALEPEEEGKAAADAPGPGEGDGDEP